MQSCGKTTVGAGVKFMYMVSASPKRLHIIAAKTTGIAEKNIIQQENGILDLHRNAVYCGNGDRNNKLPHIKFERKLIYVLGYDNKDKWENVLGSQFGCVYIDEINTADIDFVREISTCNDYLLATLNPDDPSLPVYREFVNRSRPCARYAADVPEEILRELTEEPVPGWRYWFFSFRDNLSLTEADIQRKMDAAPKSTKLYKNKILGLRGRATGLVFDLQQRHIITAAQAAEHRFLYYSIGCDTSYSRQSHDRLTFEAVGITADKKCILLLEETHNNRDKTNPFAPSDVIPLLNRFAEQVKCRYGFARTIYIDSADAGTIQEAPKPKAAKAKAHTEGVSAGHAVEVTPPTPKDNGGSGKTYSPEKIGGKSLTSGVDGGIIKGDNKSVRLWYHERIYNIPNEIPDDLPAEERAKKAFELRNDYRTEARSRMADEEARIELDAIHPNPTFDELVESKMRRTKMTKEEAIQDIYETAVKSNPEYDKRAGL